MMATRKLFAAALAAALPLASLAQPAPAAEPAPAPAAAPAKPAAPPPPAIAVYGTFNVNFQYTEAGDATAGNASDVSPRFAVSTDSSNVGVRGTLKLTDAYSAVYQCETSAALDGEGIAGLCGRNSRVGLSSFWGTLAYGNWDAPLKAGTYGTKADDPFGNTDVYGFNGLMGSPGFGVRSVTINNAAPAAGTNNQSLGTLGIASFDNRVGNSVLYWSPKFANLLSFKVQWGVDDFRSAVGTVDPMVLGAVVNFDMGPLSVVGAAEYHEDLYGIRVVNAANFVPAVAPSTTLPAQNNSASKDFAWRLAAGYDLPLGVGNLNVMGMFEQLTYQQDDATGAGAASEYSRMAWLLGAKFRTGNHEVRARYSQALDPDITAATGQTLSGTAEDELGAQNLALGYAYHLAKSTQLYAYYAQVMNDDRARYTFPVSGNAAVVAPPAGADPMAIGLGIRQAF